MKLDVDNAILESLLERPEEWEFNSNPSHKFIKHQKSGFQLEFFRKRPLIFAPDWAKLHILKDDTACLIYNAITLLKKERDDAVIEDTENRILVMLDNKETPEDPSESVVRIVAAVSLVVITSILALILLLSI